MTFNHLVNCDGSVFGCYARGHHEKEVFEKAARAWLNEHHMMGDMTIPESAQVKQGYYKVIPTGQKGESVTIFRKHKMRGSFAVTQLSW